MPFNNFMPVISAGTPRKDEFATFRENAKLAFISAINLGDVPEKVLTDAMFALNADDMEKAFSSVKDPAIVKQVYHRMMNKIPTFHVTSYGNINYGFIPNYSIQTKPHLLKEAIETAYQKYDSNNDTAYLFREAAAALARLNEHYKKSNNEELVKELMKKIANLEQENEYLLNRNEQLENLVAYLKNEKNSVRQEPTSVVNNYYGTVGQSMGMVNTIETH